MTPPEFVLSSGPAFLLGVPVGAVVTNRVLRAWERRLTTRGKALEAARLYLHSLGVELSAWVVDIIDRERQERATRPARRWKWWLWWK
jgi:hypothetical protein